MHARCLIVILIMSPRKAAATKKAASKPAATKKAASKPAATKKAASKPAATKKQATKKPKSVSPPEHN
jgi:bifunctional non-homologous end joining protein LigD